MRNIRIAATGAALLATFALTACGGGNKSASATNAGSPAASAAPAEQPNAVNVAKNMVSGKSMKINMGALKGSKQDGTASITDKDGGVEVVITLKNEPSSASEPVHIHKGTCKNLDPVPWKPLKNVVNGTSTTMVPGLTVAELKKAHYAINVHDSPTDLKTYVSCGDLSP
jgi:uncharacterized protein YdeI (BOF family)